MKIEEQFIEISELIQKARYNALKSVNTELVNLYWELGEYISKNIEHERWGNGIVQNLAVYLKQNIPCQKGFSVQNLWRMKQFYETYKEYPKLSTMLRELNWSSHLHILSKTKSMEEKEFYLRLAIKEKYSARELERQINSGFYEKYLLSDIKVSPAGKEKAGKDLTEKRSEKRSEIGLTERQIEVLMLIKENPKISSGQLSKKLNINPSAAQRHIEKLKEKSVLERVGPDKGGYWEIKEDDIKDK